MLLTNIDHYHSPPPKQQQTNKAFLLEPFSNFVTLISFLLKSESGLQILYTYSQSVFDNDKVNLLDNNMIASHGIALFYVPLT